MMSSAAMSISSIVVVVISNMIRFVKIDPSREYAEQSEEDEFKVISK